MTKKHLFKRATALLLSALLATSPALVYAEDAFFVDEIGFEEDVARDDVGYSDEVIFDDGVLEDASESASFDVVGEETFEEETSGEDEGFAADFFDDVEVSYDDSAMASDIVEDVVDDQVAAADADNATTNVTITFHANSGMGSDTTQSIESGVSTPLKLNTFTNSTLNKQGFAGWATTSTGSVTYRDGASVSFTSNTELWAVWGVPVATVGSQQYVNLKDAFAAVPWDGTVTVTAASSNTEAITVDRTCTVTADSAVKISNSITVNAGSKLTIAEGDYLEFTTAPRESSTDALQIKGGIYATNVQDYCADGYYVTSFKDGTTTKYKIISSAVAMINNLYYATMTDAFEAVNNGSGTVTLYIINDVSDAAGKVDDTIIKNNVVIATGKKNDAAASITLSNLAGSGSAKVRFDGTLTINKEVTINGLVAGTRGATSILGNLNGSNGRRFYSLGNTVTIDKDSTVSADYLYSVYGSTVNIEGALSSGGAISQSTVTSGAPLSLSQDLVIGNHGKNTINLKNAVLVVTGNIIGSNDTENGGAISQDLVTFFNYRPTTIPANAASEINLDNAVLKGASLNFNVAGTGKNVTLTNKSQLISTGALTLNTNDTITMDAGSKLTVGSWTNNGELKVDVTNLTSTDVPDEGLMVVDATTAISTSTMGKVTLIGNTSYGVSISNGDLIITKAEAALTHNGTTTYTDLATAIANMADGDTIQLLSNEGTATAYTIGKKVTIDLNGYRLQSALTISKDVTITDTYSSETGSITGKVTVSAGAKLTVEKGKLAEVETTAVTGSITINDGTVTKATVQNGALSVAGGKVETIDAGSASGTDTATLAITGGEFDDINVAKIFKSVSISTSLTKAINAVDTPANSDFVWVTSGTNSLLKPLQTAINEATAGSTIKLSGAITIASDSNITITKNIVLDLNGYTFTGNGTTGTPKTYLIGVERGGNLTVISTASTEGKITTTRDAAIMMNPSAIRETADATLIVGSSSDSGSNYFTIDGATSAIGGVEGNTNTSVTVNGGEVGTVDKSAGIANPQKNSTIVINGGIIRGVNALDITETTSGAGTISVKINDGTLIGGTNVIKESSAPKLTNVTFDIVGGNFEGKISVNDATKFITGGKYTIDPSKEGTASTNYLADGYKVDSITGKYPYQVNKDIPTYALTVTSNLTSATLSPASGTKYAGGASVSLSASAAPSGYTFGGWYAGTTLISSSLTATYTMPSATTTVTARYLKNLTVKANDDTVATGSAYTGDKTKITVTGLDTGDSNVVNTTNMTMTASTYNKDTSKVGSTHDIVLAGATVNSSFATKYTITTYTKGTLTVIEGTGPETFIADVAKLPAATAVTVDNLAATKAGVETAKSDYSKLSTTAKDLADVKTAKAKLDAVEAAVTKLEADKAAADVVTTAIAALPAASDAKASDKKAADDAKDLYDALTADQKKLISDADVAKLNAVKAAADTAEETDAAAAKKVKDDAAKLPSITQVEVSDKAAVQAVRDEYEALTADQKARIPEVDTQLKALEDVIKAKEEEEKGEDQKKADEVAAMIEAIKDAPAGKQKAATEEAREAFDELTDAQKALLPKSAETLLEDAEAAFEEGRIFGLNGQRYKVLSNGDVTYHRPQDKETVTSVSVPNQVSKGGYLFKVVKISINAFNSCPNLQWVVVGKNVVSLGKCSFKGTPKLKKVKFMGTGVKTATSAFTGAGKNKGADLVVYTKGSVVDKYESLFKGAGKLNDEAIVTEME